MKPVDHHAIQIIPFNEAEENCSFRIQLTRKLSIGLQARKERESRASSSIRGSLIFQVTVLSQENPHCLCKPKCIGD